jgi:cytochrome P450/deferrochelatase/peroxidase EfeB
MARIKYFETIIAAQKADAEKAPAPLPLFDFASLGSRNPVVRWFSRFMLRRLLPLIAAVLRAIWPIPRVGRVVIVTRRADAEAVLSDMRRFPVVYGLEMKELGGGANNILGLDNEEHDALLAILHRQLTIRDVEKVAAWTAEDSAALLEAGGGRIDVFRDLVTRTATESSARLFGFEPRNPDRFAEWTMAVSNQLFGDFFGDANIRRQAQTAAAHLRAVVDEGIARVVERNLSHPDDPRQRETLIDRLITDERMPASQVRATILGLVTAFMPTNSLAAGNMLEVLLSRPKLMGRAKTAASVGDRAKLREILLEAGKINPALSPGLWRHVPADGQTAKIGGGWRTREVRPGDLILVCIPSALRDRSGGAADPWLMFGHGPHVCLGAELALAHLVGVFEALLKQPGLARVRGRHGRMVRVGPFPTRLDMNYRAARARRALMIGTFEVRSGVSRKLVEAALESLGNPAHLPLQEGLDKTGRVQFLSVSVIEREKGSDRSVLVLEVSGDGDEAELLDLIAAHCHEVLAPLFAFTTPGEAVADPGELAQILKKGLNQLHRRPWGATGLHFDGLPELSVADVERQDKVARFAAQVVQDHLAQDLGLSTRPMDILERARRIIRREPLRENDHGNWAKGAEIPPGGTLLKPSRKRLTIADWTPPASIWSPLPKMLLAAENHLILVFAALVFAAWTTGLFLWLFPSADALPTRVLAGAVIILSGAVLTLGTAVTLAGTLMALVRRQELKEPSDETSPSLGHLQEVSRRENAQGFSQNHIIAVMPFKRGLVRRLSFAFTMWGIKQSVTYWFRPGFVVSMGTIHKARWFRVPGTNQFVFLSNFDGSWESYLEDFITRAHEGQSAAWSHGAGFPPTRFLILDGAKDGDRFKRWVRLQQRPTLCWYSRFPHLTAQQIRRNALIEDGLGRAISDTDARRWLAQFGSAQREQDELETQEAQTLIFSGFPGQYQATGLFLNLPSSAVEVAAWLRAVSGLRARAGHGLVGPPQRWLHQPEDGPETIQLPLEARVRFGEQRVVGGGGALAFTASGLSKCGLTEDCGLNSLPATYRLGMAQRAASLGDDLDGVSRWRISDDPGAARGADALLLLYGSEVGLTHEELVLGHEQLLNHFGGSISHLVPCRPLPDACGKPTLDVEHFGFRDGVSQPVLRGTRRASSPPPGRDIIAPGEFLLGYRNEQGFVAPPITIGSEQDPSADLPTVSAALSSRFPRFGAQGSESELRDFGRNGCFLAVRQLDQDPEGFREDLTRRAEALLNSYPDLRELAGGRVSEEWLAAKIIGRWRDGSPLVGHADGPACLGPHDPAPNDFSYGVDDPRGLACPLGAHVRRANPRDSQEPGDKDEQLITNRHRLLRRGRTYSYEADGDGAGVRKGLLFMALCGDLERQFEFVQRTWLNATSFHGLVEEHDPLLGGPAARPTLHDAPDREMGFTIPTAAGPVRVKDLRSWVSLRGGGYFFLPSRSALAFLIRRCQRLSCEPAGGGESLSVLSEGSSKNEITVRTD